MDPWGNKFTAEYNAERFRKAGQILPARGCLAGVQADQEYLKKIFNLQRVLAGEIINISTICFAACVQTCFCLLPCVLSGSYLHNACCHYCLASKTGPQDLWYTEFGREAGHRKTRLGRTYNIYVDNVCLHARFFRCCNVNSAETRLTSTAEFVQLNGNTPLTRIVGFDLWRNLSCFCVCFASRYIHRPCFFFCSARNYARYSPHYGSCCCRGLYLECPA